MGVTSLWTILQPVAQHCPLTSLKGQTLAVDLSGWVCESAAMKPLARTRKPYLRNLFFRVSCLLRAGVNLVFVTEGEPPELKDEVLSQRALSQYGPKTTTSNKASNETGKQRRKNFDHLLKECQNMLESLGVPCIQSSGEAEALCAYLNMNGLVNGCISEDGDCFLYGGLVVYRNFTMDKEDPHVEMYSMDEIKKQLNLDRRKLVALALLLGCDYFQKGVPGVGKEIALRFLKKLENVDVLERFQQWKTDPAFQSIGVNNFMKKVSHCDLCKHPGTPKKHERHGCNICCTEVLCIVNEKCECFCEWHKNEKLKEEWGVELKIMEKASTLQNFPNQQVIQEFLFYEDKLPNRKFAWDMPNPDVFQDYMNEHLGWTDDYSRQKCFPLISMWQLTNNDSRDEAPLNLIRIVKKRTYKRTPSFEVEWKTPNNEVITIVEPQDLILAAYPNYVDHFNKEKEATSKKIASRSKITKPVVRKNNASSNSKLKKQALLEAAKSCNSITDYFCKQHKTIQL